MTLDELEIYINMLKERCTSFITQSDQVAPASADIESLDFREDTYAEAIFLRAFTHYECEVEKMFFHYLKGGTSLQGKQANSYLRSSDEKIARRIVMGGYRFISWSKPDKISQTVSIYIEKGWPIVDMVSARAQELCNCQGIRNRIAHNSPEAARALDAVQRNLLGTERLFKITPGQFLRIRHKKYKKLHLNCFLGVMQETLEAIIDPPP